MAAGLGFKDFTTGEVLTAADVDGYLMQGVWVFASAAARDAAVTSPQEGNFAYLKDTNITTYYTGSAWANLDTTGMTNPMTTTGDMIYSSSGSTPARLGLGTANQQLRVNAGATAPEWFTPAASTSGMSLISTTSFSAVAAFNLNNVFSATYDSYRLITTWQASANASPIIRLRGSGTDETTSYYYGLNYFASGSQAANSGNNQTSWNMMSNAGVDSLHWVQMDLTDPFASKMTTGTTSLAWGFAASFGEMFDGVIKNGNTTSYDGISIIPSSGTITGTISVWGLSK